MRFQPYPIEWPASEEILSTGKERMGRVDTESDELNS
jgi:hypothetical protein